MNLTQYWSGAGVIASLVSLALISPVMAQTAQKPTGEVCQKQKVLLAPACDGDDLEPEEVKLWLFRILYAGFAGLNEFSELSALSYNPKMFSMNIYIQNPVEPS